MKQRGRWLEISRCRLSGVRPAYRELLIHVVDKGASAGWRWGETSRVWRHWVRDERARVFGGATVRRGGAVVIIQKRFERHSKERAKGGTEKVAGV